MALVRVRWSETVSYEADFEIDGYREDVPIEEQAEDQILELPSEGMDKACLGVVDRNYFDPVVVREGDEIPEIYVRPKVYEEDF